MEENLIIHTYNIAIMLGFFDVVFPLLDRPRVGNRRTTRPEGQHEYFRRLLGITKPT